VHGGSKGFFRIGLIDRLQNKILLVGPTDYGFADPLQNTAISILHVSCSLLVEEPDFDSILQMQILGSYIEEIKSESVEIQKKVEEESQN
jgi:hypothetical protein